MQQDISTITSYFNAHIQSLILQLKAAYAVVGKEPPILSSNEAMALIKHTGATDLRDAKVKLRKIYKKEAAQ